MMFLSRRTQKKALYAGLFFVSVTAIVFGVVVLIVDAPPRVATVTPTPALYQPIVQENLAVLPHRLPNGTTVVDVVVQLRNPNPRAGISQYPVHMTITGADGGTLLEHTETTHILPGSLQYVVAVGLALPPLEALGNVAIDLPEDPNFQALPDEIDVPSFNIFLRERTQEQIGSEVLETQTGLVRNTSTFDWQKVEVKVVGLDQNRRIIAAGKTFLGALLVNEQREFTVQWTQPSEAIAQVVALPTTDIFSEENILQTIGNPGTLR